MLPNRVEIQLNAALMSPSDAAAAKARQKYHRRQQAATIKAILAQQRKAAEDPLGAVARDTQRQSAYVPRAVIGTGTHETRPLAISPDTAKVGYDKKPSLTNTVSPVPKYAPISTALVAGSAVSPAPASALRSNRQKDGSVPPLQSYKEWRKMKSTRLPSPWRKTDYIAVDEEEDEEKIELPKTIEGRERLVDELQDDQEARNGWAEAESEKKLVPVPVHLPSFEFWPDNASQKSSTKSTAAKSIQSSTSPSSSSIRSLGSSPAQSPSAHSPANIENVTQFPELAVKESPSIGENSTQCSTKDCDRASSFGKSPLLTQRKRSKTDVPKPIQVVPEKKSCKPLLTVVPPPQTVPKSKCSAKKSAPISKKCKKSPAPGANVELFEQFDVLKRVHGTYTWISETEAFAVITYLLAVIGVLVYRATIV